MRLNPLALLLAGSLAHQVAAAPTPAEPAGANLALVAATSTSFVSGHEKLGALNDGATPRDSGDKSHGTYGNWPQHGTQWVQYEWPQAISLSATDVYWFSDGGGLRLPKACRLKYWDGSQFADIPGAKGLGVEGNRFNRTSFPDLKTSKLRLEMDGDGQSSTAVSEWRAYDSGNSPNFAPAVEAGVDRTVVLPGATYLNGKIKDDGKPKQALTIGWSKLSGPGEVTFDKPAATATAARFSAAGEYVLQLSADDGELKAAATVQVAVLAPPPPTHLEPVWTTPYQVSSPFWHQRTKNLIVNWIPHCVSMMANPKTPEGSIENFVQAARKLAGKTDAVHVGPVFSDGWFYNIVESMCLAQLVDPQGDQDFIAAQKAMRHTLDEWVPKILGAQAPDGYLHTQYIIQNRPRWRNVSDHEGYQAGYFIDLAIAHHRMSGGKDRRMLDAAIRLADCWVRNIGPAPKQSWYDGHQELEMALVQLARHLEAIGEPAKCKDYIALSKFLLDARRGGDEYDQSHLPVIQQYEAVGHAVRAVYCYTGMADIAMETGDADYRSAVQSIWSNIVNRKYYVTGGVGSGETSEGFGKDYSLPNNAYCESCSGCGEVFFQHRLQMAWQDARYADLFEETLYNAVLGSVDLAGKNFTYTNPLDSSQKRYLWHGCPCCVGNIPRTLLSLPTWMYTRSADALFVNLYLGSQVMVGQVGGTAVQVVQTTAYPWHGKVAITLNPAKPATFALNLRVPNRQTSPLYTNLPEASGLTSLAVNGTSVTPAIEHGYAVVTREWKAGDKVELDLPLPVQRVTPSAKIPATTGRVALRRGPLVYNIESIDQGLESVLAPNSPLSAEWQADMLEGVMVIKGAFQDGKPLLAVPNYARLNRGGRSLVWIKAQ
ncbi:MAG: glycoside hydrolase family 127 protein [Verrucomicrobia bacterium]|nr:glycoside hydrolase family 127 protein [Verrucomicrobiota bacterium]